MFNVACARLIILGFSPPRAPALFRLSAPAHTNTVRDAMQRLPYPDPGTPDLRTPLRFLRWVARGQWRTLAGGVFFGVIWMVSQALFPARSVRFGRGRPNPHLSPNAQAHARCSSRLCSAPALRREG